MSAETKIVSAEAPSAETAVAPKAILFATGCLFNQSSGPYLTVKQTAASLTRRGHAATVLGTKGRNDGEPVGWEGEALTFRRYGPYSAHFAPGTATWLRSQPPRWDLASLQGLWFYSNKTITDWCSRHGKPMMITPHGMLNPTALGVASWKKALARATYMRRVFTTAACYQAGTETEYKTLRDHGIRAPICIVGNGIARPDTETLPAIETVLPPEVCTRRVCLYLGRLSPIKGIDRLLRAWAEVEPGDDWQLVIAGGGADAYRAELESVARQAGCSNLHFTGYVSTEAKAALLAHAEFYVLPSHSEAFAMAPMEAFSLGTPALLTTGCGFPEAAREGAALEVASSQQGIAEGLSALLSRPPQELAAMGDRARAFVRARYDWDVVCAQLESVYAWMCGEADAPACLRFD